MGITPEFAKEVLDQGFDVITLGHAYRINGNVDVWFNGKTLFNKATGEYRNFISREEMVAEALRLATSLGKSAAFNKTKGGRMAYQEFKHKEEKSVAEYYHWDRDTKSSDDHLYFIKAGSSVKIGRSNNPDKRIATLNTGAPEQPEIVYVAKNKGHMESVIHRCFDNWRVRKNAEWFSYSKQIQDFIQYIQQKHSPDGAS